MSKRLCKDCCHFRPYVNPCTGRFGDGRDRYLLGRCARWSNYNRIDGESESISAENARAVTGPCQPEGIEWEAAAS